MNKINSLAVFCGSSNGSSQEYQIKAEKMGQALVQNNITLIYGGGNIGLMGKIASYVSSNNIDVIGILPKLLNLPQVVNKDVETKRIIVEGMHERKAKMYELSDGFIAMPGGIGTFEEFFEAFTWLQLGYHSKPIGLLNVNGFYDDLINFQKLLTIERKSFLKENLIGLNHEFTQIDDEIKELEDKKSSLLSILTQKDSYQKFKEYQKTLTKIEVEIERIKDKLRIIDNSIIIEEEIETNKELVNKKIENLKSAIKERKHSSINKIFNSIIKSILDSNALISLNVNKQGNIEYNADYQNKSDLVKTSEAQGTTYKKLLCVAFDLSTLINYSQNSFYKFVYHDGVLEGLDDRIKVRYIKLIKSICKKYDLQYILTLIDSDIPKDNPEIIDENEICLKLNDKDNNGKLFLNSF